MSDDVVARLVAAAPWQHPDLLRERGRAAAATGPDDEDGLADLALHLLTGLAEVFEPTAAVRHLVMEGEYGAAEELLEDLADRRKLTTEQSQELLAQLTRGREDAVDDVAARVRSLLDRGDRVGTSLPALEEIVPAAYTSLPAARTLLADREADLVAQEREVAEGLARRLAASGRPPHDRWVRHVEELLSLGEYPAARRALDLDPDTFTPLLPLGLIDRPWPWSSATLAQVAYWFRRDTGATSRPAQFADYVPSSGDRAAQEVVDALHALQDGHPDAPRRWLRAIAGLVGARIVTEGSEDDGGADCRIRLADDPQLPALAFVGRHASFLLATGGVGPTGSAEVAVRVSTRVTDPVRRGEPFLDVASVLSLLARDEHGFARTQEARRLALLRSVCSQMEPGAVLGPRTFDDAEDVDVHLWWAMYLLGFRPRQSEVAALMECCGTHPGVLSLTVVQEADRARAARTDFDTSAVRVLPDHQEAVERTVCRALSPAACLVLFTMLTWPDDLADEDELHLALLAVEEEAGLPHTVDIMTSMGILDLPAACRELAGAGHLPRLARGGSDRLALCSCGVERLLARRTPQDVAVSALRRLVDQVRSEALSAADERLHQSALKLAQHNYVNLTRHLPETPGDVDQDDTAFEARRTKESWDGEQRPLLLAQVCESAVRIVRQECSCDVLLEGEDQDLVVRGGLSKLLQALIALVGNAIEAVAVRPESEGGGTVVVTYGRSPDGRRAVIDIEDDGQGIPAAVVDSFAADMPVSTKGHGQGIGLVGAAYWVHAMHGDVEIVGDSRTWGGAHVRVTLPLVS